MTKILITGVSGFIGRHLARLITSKKGYEVHGLIRPGTSNQRISEFADKIIFHEIDLTDISGLKKFLSTNTYDYIYHIGALRGGRKFKKKDYFNANVNATEQIAISAQLTQAKLIFCSSVGVFGAIPLELPANNKTKKQEDNYYHYTKILAEAIIQKMVLYGLQAVIIRPAITYGIGDFGFPYTLIKLIDKKLLFLPNKEMMIHLTKVEYLAEIFYKLLDTDFTSGAAYNAADQEPVKLFDLASYINKELKGKDYPENRIIDAKYFNWGIETSRWLKNELWTARFELISKSWYYDIELTRKDLGVKPPGTIPAIKNVIQWYQKKGK